MLSLLLMKSICEATRHVNAGKLTLLLNSSASVPVGAHHTADVIILKQYSKRRGYVQLYSTFLHSTHSLVVNVRGHALSH